MLKTMAKVFPIQKAEKRGDETEKKKTMLFFFLSIGDAVLTVSHFVPIKDERYTRKRKQASHFVAEWNRTGPEYINVEMFVEPNLILLVVSSGKFVSREGVEQTHTDLQEMITKKFPDLKIRVTSETFFSPFSPYQRWAEGNLGTAIHGATAA